MSSGLSRIGLAQYSSNGPTTNSPSVTIQSPNSWLLLLPDPLFLFYNEKLNLKEVTERAF
ncbi:hypothetical protein TorRG33x02_288430 [Trema orientale]|uniref:Uncharacterized protein n=1 Tax=Trema orientale TaxID=63057 RepID=A0A2P5CE68_TREOI|nr:hypothetical protein TorRG33x02_288430 [Trema orientale]